MVSLDFQKLKVMMLTSGTIRNTSNHSAAGVTSQPAWNPGSRRKRRALAAACGGVG